MLTVDARPFSRSKSSLELLTTGADLVIVLDRDLHVRRSTSTVAGVLGYQPSQMEGELFLAYVHARDLGQVIRSLNEVISGERAYCSCIVRLRTAEWRWHWFEVGASNLLGDPETVGIALTLREIIG